MAEELKNRSFRISDETTEKFRQLCGDFANQNVALNALISAYEIQQAKAVLTDRQTDVSDYDAHLQALQTAFLHSLEVNENAESRIRQEFQRQLESKDSTISDLQERIKQAESDTERVTEQAKISTAEANARVEQAKNEVDSLHKELTSANKQVSELSARLESVQSQVTDKQQIIDNLNQQLTAAKVLTEKAESAETRAIKAETELNTIKSELSEEKKLHESDVKELKQQLASQQTTAEQSAQVAERLAEVAKREALADLKEKYIAELDELRKRVQKLTEENFRIKSTEKSVSTT